MRNPPNQSMHRPRPLALAFLVWLALSACGSSGDETSATTEDAAVTETSDAPVAPGDTGTNTATPPQATPTTETPEASGGIGASDGVDVGLFFDGALIGDATTEDCTLSGGADATCHRVTVAGHPVSYETGPFCPETITDGAEAGGIWFDGSGVYDIDGEFISGLAELYDDDNWLMYDGDGNVSRTESAEEFEAAARPDVDPSLQNHCVEGRLEWLENSEPITSTVLLPTQAVLAEGPATTRGNLGVTLDGVVIAQSAPVDAILGAYTIAAFDDCGGHYNPNEGYHLHGAVGCSELGQAVDGETPMFAYALDGIGVHSPLEDPESADLDECNGHETDSAGYHYHANNAAENLVIECLLGQTATGDNTGGAAGGGRPGGGPADGQRPGGGPPGGGPADGVGSDGGPPEGALPGERPEGPPPSRG